MSIETTAASSAEEIPDKKGTTTDFADWLSPMMVKELRQGLRTKSFAGLFIFIQLLMVLATFISLESASTNQEVGAFFWGFLGLILVLAIPMRGLHAVNLEAAEKTLDLLVLTRLRAFRIVSGKWASLVAQAGLLAISVLPYIFLRYFLGGVNVLLDLLLLVILVAVSAVLSAFSVCLSTGGGRNARRNSGAAGALVSILILMFLSGGLIGGTGSATSFWTIKETLLTLLLVFLYGAYLIYFFLEIGAGRLAPPAANHTTRRRILSLVVAAIFAGLASLGINPTDLWTTLGLITLGLAAVDALTDPPTVMRSVLAAFHRRRVGVLAYLLAPGWHTGALYFLVLLVLYPVVLLQANLSGDELLWAITIPPAIAIGPAAIVSLLRRGRAAPFRLYLLVQVVCSVLAAITTGVSDSQGVAYIAILSFLMPHATAGLHELDYNSETIALLLAGAHIVISLLILLTRGRPLFATMRRHLRELGSSEGEEEAPAEAEIAAETEERVSPE